jgi:hypothetical protein
MESKSGLCNTVSANIDDNQKSQDGRARYATSLRGEIYSLITSVVRSYRSDLELALCLEEKELWQKIGLENNIGHCNCVL